MRGAVGRRCVLFMCAAAGHVGALFIEDQRPARLYTLRALAFHLLSQNTLESMLHSMADGDGLLGDQRCIGCFQVNNSSCGDICKYSTHLGRLYVLQD